MDLCVLFVNCVWFFLLLNVMDVFSVGGGALLDIGRAWFSTECACCACGPSVHLTVSSICFCMSEVYLLI